jgi:DNA (cytosine-5)-methyltransferase 1
MIYGSVCSGIEAASLAWDALHWMPSWFSEIESFPCDILHHYYPTIPNLGDMTKIYENEIFKKSHIELLVGGTPCQSFSLSGHRKGLDDPRGDLALEFLRLAKIKKPRWIVWENVVGVLSSNKGRDFGAFLNSLEECGYGYAYRVLNAKYFGVPQNRRRLFVVGYLGDWRPAAEVLLDKKGSGGHTAPTTTADSSIQNVNSIAKKNATTVDARIASALVSTYYKNYYASECLNNLIVDDRGIRRLIPLEFERLMGFPDNYTNIPSATDTKRYKALGNSMAVPVMRWIGERIDNYEKSGQYK